jgi:hypothetical protein
MWNTELRRVFFVSSVELVLWAHSEFLEGFMFCDACGTAVQPGQAFCSKCGKQIIGAITAAPPLRGRVQSHSHLLAILWFAYSAFNALAGLFVFMLGTTLFPHLREMNKVPPDVPVGFLTALFSTIGILILAKAACGFIAGWGLMKYDSWARILALVLAFIALVNVPFGTAIAVYTLWVLLPAQSQLEYEALAAQAT